MGFKNNRVPFSSGRVGPPGPAKVGPGIPQFMDDGVVLRVTIEVDKAGTMKLTATPTPHPLSLVKLFTGLIQGQADFLLNQESMIIDPNKPRFNGNNGGTGDGTETEQGKEAENDHRGNPTGIQ
jgi:hypothetical protein